MNVSYGGCVRINEYVVVAKAVAFYFGFMVWSHESVEIARHIAGSFRCKVNRVVSHGERYVVLRARKRV